MTQRIYITETGERVRERGGHVDVGLSAEAQAALGDLLHFQPSRIGDWVNAGDRLFVVEGTLSAAEFYAPISGRVTTCAVDDALILDWLVTLSPGVTPDSSLLPSCRRDVINRHRHKHV